MRQVRRMRPICSQRERAAHELVSPVSLHRQPDESGRGQGLGHPHRAARAGRTAHRGARGQPEQVGKVPVPGRQLTRIPVRTGFERTLGSVAGQAAPQCRRVRPGTPSPRPRPLMAGHQPARHNTGGVQCVQDIEGA